ncbi:MAG: glycerate kinase [Pseudomonadota bacterium]
MRAMFDAAVAAADPSRTLAAHLPPLPPAGRIVVVGAGKAAAAMARALESAWEVALDRLEGTVVTRYGHALPCRRIEVLEAAHPVPDAAGLAATERLLSRVAGLTSDDLVLVLLSGGGSALLAAPVAGMGLADEQVLARALLACGADIGEINCVRKHLSRVKGGRLALACSPARVITLAISDVPGDELTVIASGPTVADPTTVGDARRVLARYGITEPRAAIEALAAPGSETPKPGDPALARTSARLVARPQQSLEAAAAVARAAGWQPLILGDSLEGEAREAARVLAGIALQVARHGQPVAGPCALISGGETTVTVRGGGRGGRNVEFQLALALALRGMPGVHALAADTDGIDGAGPAAGALVSPDTLARAQAAGLDAQASLAANDAHRFFETLGDALACGPTHTNVNDFRVILVDAPYR